MSPAFNPPSPKSRNQSSPRATPQSSLDQPCNARQSPHARYRRPAAPPPANAPPATAPASAPTSTSTHTPLSTYHPPSPFSSLYQNGNRPIPLMIQAL